MQRHMPMGYKLINGRIELQEEQVAIIRTIFTDYVAGKSMKAIARELTEKGVLNANKKPSWNHCSIGNILQNVKYQGDEFYPRIIDRDLFIEAQERRAKVERELGRSSQVNTMRNQSIFSGKIQCGDCGEIYKKYTEHAGKPSEKSKWKCKNYIFQNQVLCRNFFFTDDELKSIFIEATNELIKKKWMLEKIPPPKTPKINRELRQIENIIKELEEEGDFSNPELAKLIFRRAELYYAGSSIDDYKIKTERIKETLNNISILKEFDEEIFETIIKKMTIHKEASVDVEFINGIIITRSIEYKRKDGNNGSSKKDGGNNTTSS